MRKCPIQLTVSAIILFVFSLPLLVAGGYLVYLGGSWYYLIAGFITLIISLLVGCESEKTFVLFALLLLGSTLWSVWEVDLNWWQLLPRLWLWFAIGIILLFPWWRIPLSQNKSAPKSIGLLTISIIVTATIGIVALFNSQQVIQGTINNPLLSTLNPDQIAENDWPAYGGTNAGLHYSHLKQITPLNIQYLKEAWRIQTGDIATHDDPLEITNENTPLKVNNMVYACTPHSEVLALEPERGRTIWRYDPRLSLEGADNFKGWAHMTCRGVSYYDANSYNESSYSYTVETVKNSSCPRRIFLPTADARLIALNADTGAVCSEFGDNGTVDLSKGIGPFAPGGYYSTSPAVVTQNLVIIGGHVTDNASTNEPSGVIRAYDIANGHLIWNWDSGNPEVTTPLPEGEIYTRNSPNVWSIMSADEKLGLVYLPMGNQTPDQYGAKRTPEAEKYSAGLVALDITTGQIRWHYQFTHHDLWDMDVPAQPVLVDLKTPEGIEQAVIQPTKQGSLYVLNRQTGEPIVPIEEIAVPQGAVTNDWTAKTQPRSALNLLPPKLEEKDMWGATLLDQLSCRIDFKKHRYEGQYTPPSLQGSLIYPGNVGVFNWMGIAVDPVRQLIFTPANYMTFKSQLIPQAEVPKEMKQASEGQGLQPNKGAPYAVDLKPFLSLVGFPCQAPSWGDIAGISLVDYKVKWKHPNGTSRDNTPIVPLPFPVGVPSMGGPLTTAGGVAFMSGTLDQYIRGYDVATGKELWKARLPAGGQATPMSYRGKDGRQYILVVVGGHGSLGSKMGDYIIAYALPFKNTKAKP